MAPTKGAEAAAAEDEDEPDEGDDDDAACAGQSFADLLGPECVIKRVDKDRNVIGGAKPEEMQQELMTRASAQKRLGACAEHVKDMSRRDKLAWALDLKDRANEFYAANNLEEAAKLYNDCLVGLDLDGTEEENEEVKQKLQLPVCTNLAACMIESGQYDRTVELCDIALSVDPSHCRALYRRGVARYRVGDHEAARPDFEAALAGVTSQGEASAADEAEARSLADIERRTLAYLGHIRRFSARERTACKRMFEEEASGIYADRPGPKPAAPEQEGPVDDSDEAIDAALARARGDWNCCPCRRRAERPKVA